MTSWFEQGQGESWESGESFESPFAEGAEAWSEVTEAPTPESWGGESWAEQWEQPSSEQWAGESGEQWGETSSHTCTCGQRHEVASSEVASSESGLPEAASEQETRSWSDAPPCGKSGGGWAPSMVAESRSEAWTGEIPNESFETFEELGPAESFETYESFEPFTSSMEGETPGSPRDAVEHWKKWLCSGTQGNRVMPLIDGPTTFTAMKEAIDTATDNSHFIYLLAWWCDPWVNLTDPGTSLLDLFDAAGRKGVQIRVLLWNAPAAVPGFPNHSRLHDAAEAALNRIPNCFAQQDDAGLTRSHHQKLLVVKGSKGLISFCGGIDVNADRRYPLPPPAGSYRSDRPRNISWVGASGSSAGSPTGSPLHDVHACVTGRAASWLLQSFLLRWWSRSGSRDIDRRAPLRAQWDESISDPGAQFARVGRTFSGVVQRPGSRVRERAREVQAQDIWLRAILGARHYIYIEEQYLTNLCGAEAIRSVLPKVQHVTILIPPSEITDLNGVWRRRREFIDRITRGNPHAKKLHVYTLADKGCVRDGPHTYVHSKMAVIDDDLLLIGSANCNHRGRETDTELVVAAFEHVGLDRFSTAHKLRMALWREHLGEPESILRDPIMSRGFWDSSPTRRVCAYDPSGGTDRGRQYSDSIVDPTDRRRDDPCCQLLTICP